jgi:Sugar (and other) transporter
MNNVVDSALPKAGTEAVDYADMRRRIKAIFIGSVGNLVEWYDFYAYTAFSLYFAGAFFPQSDPVSQQLNSATVFAAGFLVRPIGGWLFGYLADHYGRRPSLTLSVLMMCFGSLIIAVTPTSASIGVLAPVMLALARTIQGLRRKHNDPGGGGLAALRRRSAADLWNYFRSRRSTARAHLVRHRWGIVYVPAVDRHPGDEERCWGFLSPLLFLDHCRPTPLDQRHCEGGTFPDPHQGYGRRIAIRARRVDVRRHGASCRALV